MNSKTLFLVLFLLFLFSAPLLADLSPLDDPGERYKFEFEEGKYQIDFSTLYLNEDRDVFNSNYSYNIETQKRYILTFDYNLKDGLKVKYIRNWLPEYSYSQNYTDTGNRMTNTGSDNMWGIECIYKSEAGAHEFSFLYEKKSVDIVEDYDEANSIQAYLNDDSRQMGRRDTYKVTYQPDIAADGLGFSIEYNYLNEEKDKLYNNERDEYLVTITYKGKI
ncbi:MAG: hypothetical protein ACLFPF_06385 [Halanaerobiales bacterium]